MAQLHRDLCLNRVQVMAKKELEAELSMRLNIENNVATLVQQTGHSLDTLMASVPTPVTQDWDCYKSSIEHFNQQCVHLGEYVLPLVASVFLSLRAHPMCPRSFSGTA
jgi:hypothetical protein